MKKLYRIVGGIVCIVLLTHSGALPVLRYPFSQLINWNENAKRQEYERYFAEANVAVSRIPIVRPHHDRRLAEREEFTLIQKDGMLIGYGTIFTGLLFSGHAVNAKSGDRRTITIEKAEILYDMHNAYIFLVTYRMDNLSKLEAFFASFLGYKIKAKRSIFSEDELGEGYSLSEQSKQYARLLIQTPKIYKKIFDQGALTNGYLFVQSTQQLNNQLSSE